MKDRCQLHLLVKGVLGCALVSVAAFLTGCQVIDAPLGAEDFSPQPSVRAPHAVAIAQAYASHRWNATERNIFHGKDPAGVQVNTPDYTMPEGIARRPGWWRPGEANTGIPYKWGGFDTPAEFDQRIAKGAYAGDVYTVAKRRALYNGVSDYTAGVDCSGLVSRCWRLPRHYSTRSLPSISRKLPDYKDLRPGDILNKRNVHVMLFAGFTNAEKTHFIAYQTGAPPSWKVQEYTLSIHEVLSWGFTPYRYNHIMH